MPRHTDIPKIRGILSADRPWACYALGDLSPGLFEHTDWFTTDDRAAVLMLFRAFGTPLLFALGQPERVGGLLDELSAETDLYLSIRPEILPLVQGRFQVRGETLMWRMILNAGRFRATDNAAVRLGVGDLPALQRLHAGGNLDGQPADDAPDFFSASMVDEGVYYGIFDDNAALMAAAGTHLVVPGEGVAAVGNVYTRPDCRGRGFASQVTGAVVAELRRQPKLDVIALNVRQDNAAAIAVYERLGFERYCPFYEGLATRELVAARTDT
jgi:ribosomal protein S18 acetylase RimI-like enzyme